MVARNSLHFKKCRGQNYVACRASPHHVETLWEVWIEAVDSIMLKFLMKMIASCRDRSIIAGTGCGARAREHKRGMF